MSGICGICEPGRALNAKSVETMLSALALPGESTPRSTAGDSAALGVSPRWEFQQVAAIPAIRIAADAELLNRPELSKTLKFTGCDPATLSTAELLARLYRERGISFIELLDGAFSIALWDEQNHRLLLAIDRLGVNSLYWRKEGNRLLFASRVGAIRGVQETPTEVT